MPWSTTGRELWRLALLVVGATAAMARMMDRILLAYIMIYQILPRTSTRHHDDSLRPDERCVHEQNLGRPRSRLGRASPPASTVAKASL